MTEQAYIQALRSVYFQLPNTHRRFSRSDQRLASNLFQRGYSLELVRYALLLTSARRLACNPAEPPLCPRCVLFTTSCRSWTKSVRSRFLLATSNTWKRNSDRPSRGLLPNRQTLSKPALAQKTAFPDARQQPSHRWCTSIRSLHACCNRPFSTGNRICQLGEPKHPDRPLRSRA